MGKRLFLLLFAGVMGMVSTSTALTAADGFEVKEPVFHAVETVVPEPEPEPEVVYQPVYTPQMANYTVTIYSGEMVAHDLSYADIYKTGKLVYGHNTGYLLGSLAYRYIGEEFTITEGGVATKYQVTDIALYEKTADGLLNNSKVLMKQIMQTAMGHSVALMTCAGTAYGNGDASHRLVVYADAV